MKTKHTSNQNDECNLAFEFIKNNHLPHPDFEPNYLDLCKEAQKFRNESKLKPKFEMTSLKKAYLAPLLEGH